jgi:hypothetical protein
VNRRTDLCDRSTEFMAQHRVLFVGVLALEDFNIDPQMPQAATLMRTSVGSCRVGIGSVSGSIFPIFLNTKSLHRFMISSFCIK